MNFWLGFRCLGCQREVSKKDGRYTCPSCGENLDAVYDDAALRKIVSRKKFQRDGRRDIFRYGAFLPLRNPSTGLPLAVGNSPLYRVGALGKNLDVPNLYLKDETREPSASFKDRASAVVLAWAREEKISRVACASTGNAGSSLACLAASTQIPVVIFVPRKAPPAKIAQLAAFGARLILVEGSYDDAFDTCQLACEKFGWYNRSTGINPLTREGKKTCAYEICEQMNWKTPDWVFVSVGDGNILSGLWKGFKDFKEAGLIEKLPKMIAVQSKKSNAVSLAFRNGLELMPVKAGTLADSICVDKPRDGLAALLALKESGGEAVEVSDEEILQAIPLVAERTGIFGEPAGVASVAGLKRHSRKIKADETAVCIITGNGLKDIASAMKARPHYPPMRCAPRNILGLKHI